MRPTIQEAAAGILKEKGVPMSARELAAEALARRAVTSNAKDPEASLGNTLEKNIRDGTYNHPKLVFVRSARGRLIGLPGASSEASAEGDVPRRNRGAHRDLGEAVRERARFAFLSGLYESEAHAMSDIINSGLPAIQAKIRPAILARLEDFGRIRG